jgi:hypothetical protein
MTLLLFASCDIELEDINLGDPQYIGTTQEVYEAVISSHGEDLHMEGIDFSDTSSGPEIEGGTTSLRVINNGEGVEYWVHTNSSEAFLKKYTHADNSVNYYIRIS